ncbi:hypothetical protein CPB85DRAFT_245835 [Mucidula mucida]|nr:hypothetical protein CPB85DRAFT_245835 [Mucidula mucida]
MAVALNRQSFSGTRARFATNARAPRNRLALLLTSVLNGRRLRGRLRPRPKNLLPGAMTTKFFRQVSEIPSHQLTTRTYGTMITVMKCLRFSLHRDWRNFTNITPDGREVTAIPVSPTPLARRKRLLHRLRIIWRLSRSSGVKVQSITSSSGAALGSSNITRAGNCSSSSTTWIGLFNRT